jgi:ketosteroid isomerase-like protein
MPSLTCTIIAVMSENVEIIRRAVEGFNRDGPRAQEIRQITDPEAELVLPGGLLDAGYYRGRDVVLAAWEAYVGEFDPFHLEIEQLVDAGDSVVARFREQGRGKESGVEVDWLRYVVYTLHQGRVIRTQYFLEEAEALKAAGLVPESS